MSKLPRIKEDQKEVEYFSLLVHQYEKLACMRIMQELRERWQLDPEDSRRILVSIAGRQLNEACYAVAGMVLSFNCTIEEVVPPLTLQILADLVVNKKITNPQLRKDLRVDLSTPEGMKESLDLFKAFILKTNDENPFHLSK